MTTRELAELVKRMREAQKDYFRHRQPHTLARSKDLELEVDKAVERICGDQQDLFDMGSDEMLHEPGASIPPWERHK